MNLRLIKIFIPLSKKGKVERILKEHLISEFWHDRIGEKKAVTEALISAESSEKVLDSLENELQDENGFRVVILPVEGSVPRIEEEEQNAEKVSRVSREELYNNIEKNANLTWTYIALVIFSATVAAIGIIFRNIPMIVGAMVIAPFIGPSVASSFATTLGDLRLLNKSVLVLFIGVFVALVFSSILGALIPFDINSPEIQLRTSVSFSDLLVSFVSGSVGVLAYTTATLTSLAGVMIAVALLPPLVVAGMLLGAGSFYLATGAFLLFLVNLIGINLAGVITFLVQKIRPRTYFEKEKARWLTSVAIISLISLLFLLTLLMLI